MTPICEITQPQLPERFGSWQFIKSNMTLVHVEVPYYEIDLDLITTPAVMLDYIFQVTGKPWVSTNDCAELIEAFRSIFNPQEHLCSWGRAKQIDAVKFLRAKYGKTENGG